MPDSVTLRDRDGRAYDVPADQVGAYQAQGFTPESDAQREERTTGDVRQDLYGGVGGAIKAAGAGLLSGLTVGLSNPLIAGLGGRQALHGLEEENPYTTIGANIIGAVAPTLLTGGAAGPEEAAGIGARILAHTPAGLTAKLGGGVSSRLAGEGAGFLAKAGAGAAGAGTEGALYGGGDYLSQVAIQDRPLTAEGFVGAMGHGALFGAPIGAGFSLGHEGLIRARKLFPREQISAAAAQGIEREATTAIKQAVDDGDALTAAAKAKLAETDAKVGLAEAGEQHTRAAFGGADPQAIADQAVGSVDKVALEGALSEFEASKAKLQDWLHTESDPDLETLLGELKPAGVQSDAGLGVKRTGAQWPPEASDINAGEASFGTEQATSAGKRKVPKDLVESVRPPESAEYLSKRMEDLNRHLDTLEYGTPEYEAAEKEFNSIADRLADVNRAAPATHEITKVGKVEIPTRQGKLTPLSNEEFDSYKKEYRHAASDEHLGAELYYSKGGDEALNQALRSGRGLDQEWVARGIKGLDEAMELPESRLPRDAELYRGLSGKWAKERFAEMKPGEVFEDPGYMSTAHNSDSKVRNEDVVFNIHAPAGTKATPIRSKFSEERELLLQRGIKFRIDRNELIPQVPTSTRWKSAKNHTVLPDKSVKIEFTDGSVHTFPPIRELDVTILNDISPAPRKIDAVRDIDVPVDSLNLQQIGQYQDLLDKQFKSLEGKLGKDEARQTGEWKDLSDKWDAAVDRRNAIKDGKVPNPAPASIPEYTVLRKMKEDYLENTVPASVLSDHGYYEPPGGHLDPVRNANAAKAIKEGQRDAIQLTLSPSGKISVTDGRHKLRAAIEAGAPIKVKWSTGAEPSAEMVRQGGKLQEAAVAGAAAASGQKNQSDDLESLLRGTKNKLDDGAKISQLGTENPAYKQIDIGSTTHPTGRQPHDNYEASAMAADERAMQNAAREVPASQIVGGPDDLMALLGPQRTSVMGKRLLSHGEPPVPASSAEYAERQMLGKRILGKSGLPVAEEDAIAKILRKADEGGVDIGPAINRAADAIGSYEASSAKLVDLLGSDAPASAQAHAKAYQEALAKRSDSIGASAARTADDINRLAPKTMVDSEIDKALRKMDSKAPKAEPAGTGVASRAADLGGAIEVLKAMGVHLPGLSSIPVIGPILGLFLKARAVMKILGRKGGSVGATAEGYIASKAAATQDRIAAVTSKLLDVGIKVTGRATHAAGAAELLATRLFPGEKNPKTKDIHELFRARMRELDRSQNPGAVATALGTRTADPHLQDAITAQVQRGLDFLAKKAPRPTMIPGMIPGDGKWAPSKAAIEEFARYVHAVNDPASVLEDLAKGHLSAEGAETLRVVYPSLFAEAQRILLSKASELQATLSYPKRIALSIMYKIPVDATMTPAHMQFLQPPPAPAANPAIGGPMQGGLTGQLTAGKQTMTALDRRAQ